MDCPSRELRDIVSFPISSDSSFTSKSALFELLSYNFCYLGPTWISVDGTHNHLNRIPSIKIKDTLFESIEREGERQ